MAHYSAILEDQVFVSNLFTPDKVWSEIYLVFAIFHWLLHDAVAWFDFRTPSGMSVCWNDSLSHWSQNNLQHHVGEKSFSQLQITGMSLQRLLTIGQSILVISCVLQPSWRPSRFQKTVKFDMHFFFAEWRRGTRALESSKRWPGGLCTCKAWRYYHRLSRLWPYSYNSCEFACEWPSLPVTACTNYFFQYPLGNSLSAACSKNVTKLYLGVAFHLSCSTVSTLLFLARWLERAFEILSR
jgi:hypothetical protein